MDPLARSEPALLVEWHPWHREFLRNLGDLFRSAPRTFFSSPPGVFWRDVFVPRGLPWRRFAQSAGLHAMALAALAAWTRYVIIPVAAIQPVSFQKSDVVYYSPEEYLPPLNTGGVQAPARDKGDPIYAKQPIISVPPEADNRRQTIVTPPNMKLKQDVPLPNVVTWSKADLPVQAAPEHVPGELKLRSLPTPVIAPPPEISRIDSRRIALPTQAAVAPPPQVQISSDRIARILTPAVIAPPPEVGGAIARRGEISIGHSDVVPPAPKLPVGEQRSVASIAGSAASAVVPPPPSIPSSTADKSGGRLIALNLHPVAPTDPVQPPPGNRRGTFAATPEGKPDASGTPNVTSAAKSSGATGSGGKNQFSIPSGLMVGSAPRPQMQSAISGTESGEGTLLADTTPPRVNSTRPMARAISADNESPMERQIFQDRRSYAMTVNIPNLNSAGGSWVIHFAEQQEKDTGNLSAPVPTQSVDPAYPAELMKQNVEGTVTLYAVIGSDGSVSGVRVLEGVDDRLDRYAVAALSRWRFRPATRNGTPVPLEAVVMIPFRPSRHTF